MLNYANIADETGVSMPTVKKWISMLERTGIVYILQPFAPSPLNRAIKTPNRTRGTGVILCLTDRKTYLRENLIALPIEYV